MSSGRNEEQVFQEWATKQIEALDKYHQHIKRINQNSLPMATEFLTLIGNIRSSLQDETQPVAQRLLDARRDLDALLDTMASAPRMYSSGTPEEAEFAKLACQPSEIKAISAIRDSDDAFTKEHYKWAFLYKQVADYLNGLSVQSKPQERSILLAQLETIVADSKVNDQEKLNNIIKLLVTKCCTVESATLANGVQSILDSNAAQPH